MGSDIPEERLKELRDVVFVFDNDKTGIEKSIKYAKLGHKVVIYPKDIQEKDVNDLLKKGWSKDDLTELIKANTFQGFEAVIKLTVKL
jgi:DNA primase